MKLSHKQLFLLALAAPCAIATAPARAYEYLPNGLGQMHCADYLGSPSLRSMESTYIQWVSGFIAGINERSSGGPVKHLEPEEVAIRLTLRCQKNPSESIVAAARAIARGYGAWATRRKDAAR